ncbi:MAG: hypothetical protein ABI868_22380 [Acidobacteriota bacterium]
MPAIRFSIRFLLAGVLLASIGVLSAVGAGPTFFPDDPIWTDPISQDVKAATRYEPDLVFQTVANLFGQPGDPVLGQRARNINTVDEVPDGPFYVNRAGKLPLTPEIVARASNTSDGPAAGPWTVISAKSDGITPGFTIRDSSNGLWFIKFDPPGWPGMATGTEVVAAKLFWAVGYHVVEYHIEHLVPSNLRIGAEAKITPSGEAERRMQPSDVEWLLSKAMRDANGSYRVIASRAAPGRPVGRIRFDGTRADDPNDIVPHEHHRELRGYSVFAAWLNHVDAKGINSLTSLVTENGRTFIRQYLLDFGSALGSGGIGPTELWEGSEPLVEDGKDITRRAVAFGVLIPEWRTTKFYVAPSVGRLPADPAHWNPASWRPHITNAAFRHARADDTFWAANKMTFITDAMIDAAIKEGQFNDPPSEQMLAKMIRARRDRILQTYLTDINPIVEPALAGDGRLTFRNAAVDARVAAAPSGYEASWSVFDNATGQSRPIGTSTAATTSIQAPSLPAADFIKVDLRATGGANEAWSRPVSVFFRRADGWSLVGFDRMPGAPAAAQARQP